MTPCSAVLEITINDKFRNVSIEFSHLTSLLDLLETENLPFNNWERKSKLLFIENTLSDLQWLKLHQCNEKLFTTVEPAEVGEKPSSCKLVTRKDPDAQDVENPPELVERGLHIDIQVGRNGHETHISKTTRVCLKNRLHKSLRNQITFISHQIPLLIIYVTVHELIHM